MESKEKLIRNIETEVNDCDVRHWLGPSMQATIEKMISNLSRKQLEALDMLLFACEQKGKVKMLRKYKIHR